MERRRITLAVETVDDCNKCNPSACCMGRLVLQLTEQEANLMRSTGNRLFTHVAPAPYDTEDAPYPIGVTVINGIPHFDVDPEKPTEPLPAHHGRYVMPDKCSNLEIDLLGRTSCSIYEERPGACASFAPGGQKCRQMQERLKLGI